MRSEHLDTILRCIESAMNAATGVERDKIAESKGALIQSMGIRDDDEHDYSTYMLAISGNEWPRACPTQDPRMVVAYALGRLDLSGEREPLSRAELLRKIEILLRASV